MTQHSLTYFIIGIIIFSGIITGGTVMMSQLSSNKDDLNPVDMQHIDTFNESFNTLSDVETSVGRIRGNIQNASVDPGMFGFLNSLISTSWNGLQLMFGSYDFMNEALAKTEDVFGVPAWASTLAILTITIIIAFQIWGAVFQRDL